MLELSLHILDVVENGLAVGADLIEIGLEKDEIKDRLRLTLTDNGAGILAENLPRVTDPFFTTRTTRRVGLGLPLLQQAAERCEGRFCIDSTPGRGTRVEAEFRLSHLDRAPLGDMLGTLISLIVGQPEVDFVYRQQAGPNEFVLDTREIKAALDGVPLSNPEVINFLRENLQEGLAELGSV
ncbi:MAG: ATP-binding protein [Pseudomonadota bacterium]